MDRPPIGRPSLSPELDERHVTALEQTRIAFVTAFPNHPDRQPLRQRYRMHRRSLVLFWPDPDLPPTNNAAVPARRTRVISRQVTGGFRSAWRAPSSADLISCLATARRPERACFAPRSTILAARAAFAPLPEEIHRNAAERWDEFL